MARSELTSLLRVSKEHRTAEQERRLTAASGSSLRQTRRKGRRSSPSPLLFASLVRCRYDDVGKDSALALRCLVLVCPLRLLVYV